MAVVIVYRKQYYRDWVHVFLGRFNWFMFSVCYTVEHDDSDWS
ncbi:MAG: hypothetical protein NTW21_08160 [Verrucomicrobia bacterium]|nr:hypothetical protein [Verrucomicrobiota bacterium]